MDKVFDKNSSFNVKFRLVSPPRWIPHDQIPPNLTLT